MKKTIFSREWEFINGLPSNMPGMPKNSVTVNLPHDFMIGQDTREDAKGGADMAWYPGGVGTYTKYFDLDEVPPVMELLVEGCYGNAVVNVNGSQAGKHHYGYTPFTIDLHPYVHSGKNRVEIVVNNDAQPAARWYTGSGLYRDVYLLTGGDIAIGNDGLFLYTKSVSDGTAEVGFELTVRNPGDETPVTACVSLGSASTEVQGMAGQGTTTLKGTL